MSFAYNQTRAQKNIIKNYWLNPLKNWFRIALVLT
jgi:hypothetical protein